MARVKSEDGTAIAFDKTGTGPSLVIVTGALAHRNLYGDAPLATELSKHFTVYTFDRRGRGESTDSPSYAVEREIEDVAALIDDAGGSAYLYGISSGAALALRTAAKLGSATVTKLALYEPPYGADDEKEKQDFANQRRRVTELVERGEPGEAVAFFMSALGTPPEAIEEMKGSADWEGMKKVECTLTYDFAVLGDGSVPHDIASAVTVPTLVMDGENTMDFMHATADRLAEFMSHAERNTLEGQTHQADAKAVAPVLIEFFTRSEKE
jgi:pimeloyl-ACP methyl ester carboxylesterase